MQAIKQLELEGVVALTYNISEADAVIALHSKLKKNSQIQAVLKDQDIPVFFVKVLSAHFSFPVLMPITFLSTRTFLLPFNICLLFVSDRLPVTNH